MQKEISGNYNFQHHPGCSDVPVPALGESSQLQLPPKCPVNGDCSAGQPAKGTAAISSAQVLPPDTGLTPPAQATRHRRVLLLQAQ